MTHALFVHQTDKYVLFLLYLVKGELYNSPLAPRSAILSKVISKAIPDLFHLRTKFHNFDGKKDFSELKGGSPG